MGEGRGGVQEAKLQMRTRFLIGCMVMFIYHVIFCPSRHRKYYHVTQMHTHQHVHNSTVWSHLLWLPRYRPHPHLARRPIRSQHW